MIYFIIAALAAGFASGYMTAHQIDQADILALKIAIERSNHQGTMLLAATREQVALAKNEAEKSNLELDNAHQSAINTINALDTQLDGLRLFKPRAQPRCSDAMPVGSAARVSEDAASDAEFSRELDRLVKSKAAECDRVAAYALNAYKFVNTGAGCGLALPTGKKN